MDLNQPHARVDASRFTMIPGADIPRSKFDTSHRLKTTFNFDYLIPIYIDEVLPADIHQGEVTVFARLATPLFPIMDNITLETFFFFVPSRLLWTNWVKLQGERANPSDSIDYTVPYIQSPNGGFAEYGIYDYFGLPTKLTAGQNVQINALPLRAYALIYDEWFRDENLQTSTKPSTGDGPDLYTAYTLFKRNKKHDYFTSALPWPLKGGTEVALPLGGQAPVRGITLHSSVDPTDGTPGAGSYEWGGATPSGWSGHTAGTNLLFRTASGATSNLGPVIFADLSAATGATINALRLAVQTQRLLERDARGGTRYTEILRSHFGIEPQDARLQRPEYIGGGRTYVDTQAIPQTVADRKASDNTVNNPLGALGAAATASDQHSFTLHAQEHGYIIGLANVSGEVSYQQGLHRLWTRRTRYEFYMPVFAFLGEQAIRNDEIYATGTDATDTAVFGYQERWAEYKYKPNRVTGAFRSTSTGNIDEWHLAEEFATAPALNSTFIQQNTPTARIFAGTVTNNVQVLLDTVMDVEMTRAMPMFSVPGMMDHF